MNRSAAKTNEAVTIFLLNEIITNYLAPEHKGKGEIADARRQIDKYWKRRQENESQSLGGKVIQARFGT